MASKYLHFLDSLYGDVSLNETSSSLVATPLVQRLRHVRLSNIDSMAMPGIAGLSRYEHVIGVAYLAQHTALAKRISSRDVVAFTAAALLHDWAITAYGHLVEEAFQYVGATFDHESKLYEMVTESSEIGGVDRQVFRGRNGLARWLEKVASPGDDKLLLKDILEAILGKGKFGRVVCGDIDLDNIDNVFRMAFHMGLGPDRQVPVRLASQIVGIDEATLSPIFTRAATDDISKWLVTRRNVYEHLMLAEPDFTGKLMLLYATVQALQHGELNNADWDMTDDQFIARLLTSKVKECSKTVERWLVGEFWVTTPLMWMEGSRPKYRDVLAFSEQLSSKLGRTCFAYCIKDKRDRKLSICFEDGNREMVGQDSAQWLLGVGSSTNKGFGPSQTSTIFEYAETYFNSKKKGEPARARPIDAVSESNQLGLL